MSDYDDLDEQDEQPSQKRNWRRDLEDRAAKAEAEAQRAAQLERELAFYKADIPMSDPRMAYFVKGYDGPLTPDAIKAAAVQAGFVTASPAEQEREASLNVELQQHQRLTDAATGVSTGTKLTAADVQILAQKAAAAAPPDKRGEAYYAVLQEHGLTKMQMAPQ